MRHDERYEERTALRKLRVLRLELQNAHESANHPTVASFRGRIGAILTDVETVLAAEEARVR